MVYCLKDTSTPLWLPKWILFHGKLYLNKMRAVFTIPFPQPATMYLQRNKKRTGMVDDRLMRANLFTHLCHTGILGRRNIESANMKDKRPLWVLGFFNEAAEDWLICCLWFLFLHFVALCLSPHRDKPLKEFTCSVNTSGNLLKCAV